MDKRLTFIKLFLIVGLSALLFYKGILPAWNSMHSDFVNYYVSAKLISAGLYAPEKLYDNDWFQSKINEYGIKTRGKFAPFPPLTAFVMLPLSSFDPITAQRIFTVLNLLALGLGMFALKKITQWPREYVMLSWLLLGWGLTNNIAFGQLYLVIAVGILIVFRWLTNNWTLPAGLILGFFVVLKYFPVVFSFSFFLIGWLEYREETPFRKNKYLNLSFYTLATIIVLFIFQTLFFGKLVMTEFVRTTFIPHLNGELRGQGPFSFEFQSWDSLLRNLFVPDSEQNPNPWINWPAGKSIFKIAIAAGAALITTVTLFRFRKSRFRNQIFISLPSLAALVLLPASATYHFVFLLPSLVLLMNEELLNLKNKIIIALIVLMIGLIPYHFAFELAKSWGVVFAYPRLGLITILFLWIVTILNKHETELA